jgi:hypothetical protein
LSVYVWSDHANQPLAFRYLPAQTGAPAPPDVVGRGEWEAFVYALFNQSPADVLARLKGIRTPNRPYPVRRCPRVFVSHRQSDARRALRIAHLAHARGMEYWLDVINVPPSLPAVSLSAFNQAILIAAIIEMALINCTHVIAVLTRNTNGSQWVPYEYGRIKDDPPAAVTAACWHDTASLPASDLPGYLHLGHIITGDAGVDRWIGYELSRYPTHCIVNLGHWGHGDTTPLDDTLP